MGGGWGLQTGKEILRSLASYLKPESVGTKIQVTRPLQRPELPDEGLAEDCVVIPDRKNTSAWFGRKVHLTLNAVVEAQPDSVVL